jgi:hypothetical protein
MPEKPGEDPFLKSLTKKQRERYDGIQSSFTRTLEDPLFKQALIEEFGASSIEELAIASRWAVKNNVEFNEMIPKYREFIQKGSKK